MRLNQVLYLPRRMSGAPIRRQESRCPSALFLLSLSLKTSGDHSGGVTPDPIPNSAVKPSSADGTTRAIVWESRSLPELFENRPGPPGRFFFGARGSKFPFKTLRTAGSFPVNSLYSSLRATLNPACSRCPSRRATLSTGVDRDTKTGSLFPPARRCLPRHPLFRMQPQRTRQHDRPANQGF